MLDDVHQTWMGALCRHGHQVGHVLVYHALVSARATNERRTRDELRMQRRLMHRNAAKEIELSETRHSVGSARFAQAVEITTATYDQIASDYAQRYESAPEPWAERLEAFIDLLAEAEERRPIPAWGRPGDDASLDEYLQLVPVLDAGCGAGRDARALAGQGLPVLGVDLSQGMLDEAGERTARRLPRGSIRYTVMDLRHLDLPDASCRGVWCAAALPHVPRRSMARAMAELARVCRAGAPLALVLRAAEAGAEAEQFTEYPHPTPRAQNAEEAEDGEGDGPRDLRLYSARYTAEETRALAEGAGLIVDEVASLPPGETPEPGAWLWLVARKP